MALTDLIAKLTGETIMPLTKKGKTILKSMRKTYGKKKASAVFYASIQKKKIKGAERKRKKK